MRLTTQTDYGLRLMMLLAMEPGRLHTADEVADRYGISRHHVAKIAKKLVQGGFVEGVRGRGGGLRLARTPDAIGLGEVVRALEGPVAIVECFERGSTCVVTSACRLQRVLHEALEAFFAVLDRHTLRDAVGTPASQARMQRLLRQIPIVNEPFAAVTIRPPKTSASAGRRHG